MCSSDLSILSKNTNYQFMKTGSVKFFNHSKGYGFIIDKEDGQEYFVHVTGLKDEIREGDTVNFELKDGKKGLNAVNVSNAG